MSFFNHFETNFRLVWIEAKGFRSGEMTMTRSRLRTLAPSLMPNQEAIRSALIGSVRATLERDWDLIALGCHEQAIAHRIAVYLERRFKTFSTDCEYNRREGK